MTNSLQALPQAYQSIPRMFEHNCDLYKDEIAMKYGKQHFTYQDFKTQVTQCSHALQSQYNLTPGDRVCLWAENSWKWAVSAFAIWHCGAIVVPISNRLKPREVLPLLEMTCPTLLLTHSGLQEPLIENLLRYCDSEDYNLPSMLKEIIDFSSQGIEETITFDSLTSQTTSSVGKPVTVQPDDIAEILFTSGTTGRPKAVTLTHQQLLQNYWDWSGLGNLSNQDNYLVIAPFSHGFGINAGLLACAIRGMTNVIAEAFHPKQALQTIQTENITVMGGPPSLFTALAETSTESNQENNSLKTAYVGAATVPETVIQKMKHKLGIKRVVNAYGLTEACSVSMTREDDSEKTISQTVGKTLPGMQVKIVDNDDKEVPHNTAGEILIKGYGISPGYWSHDSNGPSQFISEQGKNWFRSGDIGSLDQDGNLSIIDRKKDMYISHGFNVYPADVEKILAQHPAISQAAVVGVEDSKKGQVGCAFIVNEANTQCKHNELLSWAKSNMADYKVPQYLFTVEALPLNANGKVRKELLQQQASEQVIHLSSKPSRETNYVNS